MGGEVKELGREGKKGRERVQNRRKGGQGRGAKRVGKEREEFRREGRGKKRGGRKKYRKEGRVGRKEGLGKKRERFISSETCPLHAHTHWDEVMFVGLFAGIPCPRQMPTDFLNDDSVYQ